ncbi:MAG TPA: hypothetical protein VFZ83_07830 [Acidimicrobiia bacterium]|nr:hypothetical protein [Acidimicrobiia bacterium]
MPAERVLPPALAEWLTREHSVAPDGWCAEPPLEDLHCHPDLVERVATLARTLRDVRRTFVDGCPVLHHPSGPPFAAAFGTSGLVVRTAERLGALDPGWRTTGLDASWRDVDPWAADVTFTRATTLLRDAFRRAYDGVAR